jgi:hypothetical protein
MACWFLCSGLIHLIIEGARVDQSRRVVGTVAFCVLLALLGARLSPLITAGVWVIAADSCGVGAVTTLSLVAKKAECCGCTQSSSDKGTMTTGEGLYLPLLPVMQ